MIVILMMYHGHNLQSSIDYVGELCRQTIDGFIQDSAKVPSWDPETDDMVARYIQGLRDWIVGYVHSSSLFGNFRNSPTTQLAPLVLRDHPLLRRQRRRGQKAQDGEALAGQGTDCLTTPSASFDLIVFCSCLVFRAMPPVL
jgi:hypothetical protein